METIAVDVMGGDKAPDEAVAGALDASEQLNLAVALVGTKEVLGYQMARAADRRVRVELVEASQTVAMNEAPTGSWREKKDSSIAVGIGLVKEGKAEAFVSAGNTGAIVAASLFSLGTMPSFDRPAIATLFTTTEGRVAIALDIGANVECRPSFLLQFGRLGSEFMATVFKMRSPRVALVSNGEEESKGTRLVREAHRLLKESDLNFIGNAEGFDIPKGTADVFVTDGFTGNVMLKLSEALTESIFLSLRDALGNNPLARASKFLWGPPIMSVARQWDYTNIGGAPLLGVNGRVIMAHGRSDAQDIKNAIGLAQRMVKEGWIALGQTSNLGAAPVHQSTWTLQSHLP